MSLALSTKIAVSPKVLASRVGNEMVLLEVGSGTYFGLDPVGARIWELASEFGLVSEIVDILNKEYEAPNEILERDTLKLIEELVEKNLVAVMC